MGFIKNGSVEITIPAENMNIGRLLKKIRSERGFHLSTVAEAVSLTPSSLSQIENSKITPSISSLSDILKFYRIPMSEFFKQIEQRDLIIVRLNEVDSLKTKDSGVTVNLLASKLEMNMLESYRVIFSDSSGIQIKNLPDDVNGERFLLVIRGEIDIEINEKNYTLCDGDSINFKSYYKCNIFNNSQ